MICFGRYFVCLTYLCDESRGKKKDDLEVQMGPGKKLPICVLSH